MREPAFWWGEPGAMSAALGPLERVYGLFATRRMSKAGHRAGVPVICIGNPTVGGAGKTPVAIAVARMLLAEGEAPVLLSRGYGGETKGPVRVDPSVHRASEVGDEPLLLARAAPTVVARDRVAGSDAAVEAGASVIVMDDGFQNPALVKDLSILVIDARRIVGNGRMIPAGPLRAPFDVQLGRAQGILVIGSSARADAFAGEATAQGHWVFRGRLVPDAAALETLKGRRVLAFAGIGDPDKFFATLTDAGIALAAARAFADHHRYTREEADALVAQAARDGLALVTTEKDIARLSGDSAAAPLADKAQPLPVTFVLDDRETFRRFLLEGVARGRRRAQADAAARA